MKKNVINSLSWLCFLHFLFRNLIKHYSLRFCADAYYQLEIIKYWAGLPLIIPIIDLLYQWISKLSNNYYINNWELKSLGPIVTEVYILTFTHSMHSKIESNICRNLWNGYSIFRKELISGPPIKRDFTF